MSFDPGLDAARETDQAPVAADTFIPEPERAAVAQVMAEIASQYGGQPPAPGDPDMAALTVRAFLLEHFRYSLVQSEPGEQGAGITPLARFLTQSRTGHCEYFATAAAMLLRQAGIPTRYATGYLAYEYDPDSGYVLVRANHGHAWVLYWDGALWRELDATPPSWAPEDAASAPFWQPLADFRERALFFLAKLRWLNEARTFKRALAWALPPLILFLVLRLALRGGLSLPRRTRRAPDRATAVQGADSPLYRVEAALTRTMGPRPRSEPLGPWLLRHGGPDLARAAALHNRLRFDTRPMSPAEHEELRQLAAHWLAEHDRRGRRPGPASSTESP